MNVIHKFITIVELCASLTVLSIFIAGCSGTSSTSNASGGNGGAVTGVATPSKVSVVHTN